MDNAPPLMDPSETTNVDLTHAVLIIDNLIELGKREADALAQLDMSAPPLADLHLRLALIAWNTPGRPEAVGGQAAADLIEHLMRAKAHPLAPLLLLSSAVAERRSDLLDAARAACDVALEAEAHTAMLRDISEAWLYRFAEPARAADVARAALAESSAAELSGELLTLCTVALAAGESWAELGALLADAAVLPNASMMTIAEALHVLMDRMDDVAGAAALLERVAQRLTGSVNARGSEAIHHYRVATMALEVAATLPDLPPDAPIGPPVDVATLRRRQLALLGSVEGASREVAAIRFLLADHLRAFDPPAAAEILAQLATPQQGMAADWGPNLAALTRYHVADTSGDWIRLSDALTELYEAGAAGVLSGAYGWRAAEIVDARLDDPPEALGLWRGVPAGTGAESQPMRAIERLLLGESPGALIAHMKSLATSATPAERLCFLRRAAAMAESRVQNLDQALALQTLACEIGGVSEYEQLLRLHRRKGERMGLAEAYRALTAKTDDPRMCAALHCALGLLLLEMGKPKQAERLFVIAARQAPRDPLVRTAMAGLYRFQDRVRELAVVLGELSEMVVHDVSRNQTLRELGRLQARVLGDTRQARVTLERALEIEPADPGTLHVLAQLCDSARDWERALELRKRALALLDSDSYGGGSGDSGSGAHFDAAEVDRVALYLEIGDIEENRTRNDDAALEAYEAAYAVSRDSSEALHAQARILRRQRRFDLVLDVLRAELALGPDRERQLQIQLDIADITSGDGTGDRDNEASLQAYLNALDVDPQNASALAGVLAIGRAEARWDVIAQAYRNAPRTAENLAVLAEALEKQGDFARYVEVRAAQIAHAPSPEEKARMAHELGEIHHRKLGRIDDAIAAYRQAISFGVAIEGSQRELASMLEEHERWPELVIAFEQELATVVPTDVDRQVGLLLRLGSLRRDKLGKPGDAALAYEGVLELAPQHIPALEALESLYETLSRDQELLRVLDGHAEATEDTGERCQIYVRTAEILARRGDGEGAVAAYRKGFETQPANRSVFTSMEKLCYKLECWADVMSLYQRAVELVESGTCRAYRLSDLYARRGQVQLQYLKAFDDAAASYLRVIELDPGYDTAIKFIESIFSQQSDWVGLISAYEKRADLLGDDLRRLDSLRRAARVAGNKLKEAGDAARIYERILEIEPSDKEALTALERFYDRNKDWDKLVGVLKRSLDSTQAGDDTTALLRRIAQICEEGLRDSKRATEHYRRILDIAPGNREALDALARIYESTEQWAEFIDITRRQIRVTSDRNVKALLYFKCGSVMEAKFGKEEDAIRYYDAAIKTSPSCLPAVHGLRDLYRRREDWPRVIQTLELEVKLWQDDKERAGVFAQIGRIYDEHLRQPDRALHYYESALAVDPDCVPANKALFEHHFERSEWERALPLAQALAQKVVREGDPAARSEFYRKCGIVSWMTGDPRTGAESLIVALEIKPTNLEALEALVELSREHASAYGDLDGTFRELEKIYRKRDDAHTHLAHVRVAQAIIAAREGDLERAERLYAEATHMCPNDLSILSSLVDLHADLRRWGHAVDALVRFVDSDPPPPEDVRLQALIRQAELHADYEMDPHRAIAVLRRIIRMKPTHQDAHYLLAQEQFILKRYDEARASIDRVIELAAAPGEPLSPEALARYYYYRGRIIEASGDSRGATSQYRRASEYDPGYAPPALALAKRAAEAGDQRQSETLLIGAAHAAMESGGAAAAIPLQRGLARILLASGDRSAAIEAYRGILNVQPDGAADRVALAEIYAVDDVTRAISELRKVVHRDIHHAPAYRLLASLYLRSGEKERAHRVLSVMDMLGFAEESERAVTSKLRSELSHMPLRRGLEDNLRAQLMLTSAGTGTMGEIFAAIAPEVTALFPRPATGERLVPIQAIDDPALKAAVADVVRLCGVEPELYIGQRVPGEVVLMAYPRHIVVIDQNLLSESDAARRFLLGWAFEAIRGGYALLFNLGRRQRAELGTLFQSLLLPEADRAAPTNDFIRSLSKHAVKIIEHHVGKEEEIDTDAWIDGMLAAAKRAGLFVCDDFRAATRMIARLGGENPSSEGDLVALGAVMGGSDLVRFYLADEYHKLREILSIPATRSPADRTSIA